MYRKTTRRRRPLRGGARRRTTGVRRMRGGMVRLGVYVPRPVTYGMGRRMRGGNFFGDVWGGIKTGLRAVRSVVEPVARVASFMPGPIGMAGRAATAASAGSRMVGLGRRRRMRGGTILGDYLLGVGKEILRKQLS